MKKFLVFALVVALSISTTSSTADFKAGAALRVITPEKLLPISGGTGKSVPAREKKGDLYARALVMEQGDTHVAVVGLDVIGFPTALCGLVTLTPDAAPSPHLNTHVPKVFASTPRRLTLGDQDESSQRSRGPR